MEKICKICEICQPLDNFHMNKSGTFGRHNECKSCRSKKRKSKNFEKPVNGSKICPSCNKDRPFSFFSKDKSSSDGSQTYCRDCQHGKMKVYYSEGGLERYVKRVMRDTHHNAQKRKISVEITEKDVLELYQEQEGKCALTGRELTFNSYTSRNKRTLNKDNLSIDRKDSSGQYTRENIHLLSSFVNTCKWDLPMADFIEYCCLIAERYKCGQIKLN